MLSDAIFCNSKHSTILWVTYDFCEPESNNTRTLHNTTDFELFLFVKRTAVCNEIEVFSLTDKFVETPFSLLTLGRIVSFFAVTRFCACAF